MKVRFCVKNHLDGGADLVAEFEVNKAPTGEQVAAIYEYIKDIVDNYSGEDEIDYEQVCFNAAYEHLEVLDKPVAFTFYI